MNVLIDKEHMMFLRKMQDHSALNKLGDIECPHIHIMICYADAPMDFNHLTDLELKLLIKNSNGPDVTNLYSKDSLCKIVHDLVKSFPEYVVNAFEVDLQWRYISEGDSRRYLYVRGSTVPRLAEGLAELAALQCAEDARQSVAMHANKLAAPVAASSTPASFAVRESSDFSMPKAGTSTHTIFMYCATLWKESGFSADKNTLDNIRKKAVDQLVPQGLNISTVRTQAARWYQHRTRLVL
jgi:hypothetical protein